MTKNRSIV